jgi:hypothetical protein
MWKHIPPEINHLRQQMGGTGRRSIERWLTELEQAGWLIWNRTPNQYQNYERFKLLTVKHGAPNETHGAPAQTHGAPNETHGAPAQTQQPPFHASTTLQIFDSDHDSDHDSERQRPPTTPKSKGGGDGPFTETEIWLIEQGFSPITAHEFCELSLAAAQRDYQRRRHDLNQGLGAIVQAWRAAPPVSNAQPARQNNPDPDPDASPEPASEPPTDEELAAQVEQWLRLHRTDEAIKVVARINDPTTRERMQQKIDYQQHKPQTRWSEQWGRSTFSTSADP